MNISALEVCKRDLYTDKDVLMERYPAATVEKVLRIRDIHQRMVADPTVPHREIVNEIRRSYGVSEQCVYADMRIVRDLLPTLTEASRAFHRYRANEMLMETYRMAKEKGNIKVMAETAAQYAKYNNIDREDETESRYDEIVPQPFIATTDPSVLGIEPIPNLRDEINRLLQKYQAETVDIEDVKFEEVDLEESRLFPEENKNNGEGSGRPEE